MRAIGVLILTGLGAKLSMEYTVDAPFYMVAAADLLFVLVLLVMRCSGKRLV
jgi:hypothetical protein